MEPPWNACQPSTVCLFQVHWKETWLHSSAWLHVSHTLCSPAYLSKICATARQLLWASAWHKHTKPSHWQNQGAAHCVNMLEWTTAGRCECQTMNESSAVRVHPCQWEEARRSRNQGQKSFLQPFIACHKAGWCSWDQAHSWSFSPRPGPFLRAQLGSPGQWGSCVCCATGSWLYSLDSPGYVYSPPWCSGARYLFVCIALL